MRNFLTGLVLLLLVGTVAGGYLCLFIVDETKTALVMRFGKVLRKDSDAGLKFKLPWDNVLFVDKRIITVESKDLEVLVEGRYYKVSAITMYRIADVEKFRTRLFADTRVAEERISTRMDGILREIYLKRSFQAALSDDRINMMREIRDQLKLSTDDLGIKIIDVRIKKTDLSKEVLESTYNRMNKERRAEADKIRAEGDKEATRIKAEADRIFAELEAKANRDAEIVKGEGDAERNRIFAEAFSKDPEFFAFYRSMNAYKKSLEGKNTNLVLTPDSDFFRYLQNPAGAEKKQEK